MVTWCVRYPVRDYVGIREKGGYIIMAKKKGVSSKTHTKKQLDDYANQNNPNKKAYQANKANQKAMRKKSHNNYLGSEEDKIGVLYPLDWMCYSNPYEFD